MPGITFKESGIISEKCVQKNFVYVIFVYAGRPGPRLSDHMLRDRLREARRWHFAGVFRRGRMWLQHPERG